METGDAVPRVPEVTQLHTSESLFEALRGLIRNLPATGVEHMSITLEADTLPVVRVRMCAASVQAATAPPAQRTQTYVLLSQAQAKAFNVPFDVL